MPTSRHRPSPARCGGACDRLGVKHSMDYNRVCFDIAMVETFFATLKTELYNRRDWPTWAQGRPEVACWIEMVYNRRWLHSPTRLPEAG